VGAGPNVDVEIGLIELCEVVSIGTNIVANIRHNSTTPMMTTLTK